MDSGIFLKRTVIPTGGFLNGSVVKKKNPLATQEVQEMWVRSLGGADPLEEDVATHSSVPAWEIPWTR